MMHGLIVGSAKVHSPNVSPNSVPPTSRPDVTTILPPYTSPVTYAQQQYDSRQPQTPSSYLGIHLPPNSLTPTDSTRRFDWATLSPSSPVLAPPEADSIARSSPGTSPGVSALDASLPPLGDRRNTEVRIAASTNSSPDTRSAYSRTYSETVASLAESAITTPELFSSDRSRQSSIITFEDLVPENTMRDLQGASM